MLIVLGLMLSGVLVGYFLRGKKVARRTGKAVSLAIFVLLFLLGVSVGVNPQIMDNLTTLGIEAIIITIGALSGSLLSAWAIYKFLFTAKKNRKHNLKLTLL